MSGKRPYTLGFRCGSVRISYNLYPNHETNYASYRIRDLSDNEKLIIRVGYDIQELIFLIDVLHMTNKI